MGRQAAVAQLNGAPGIARALTFLPESALEAIYWGKASGPAEALATLAADLGVDLAFVPAASVWADEAAGRLQDADIAVAWAVSGPLGRVVDEDSWEDVLRLTASDPAALAHRLAETLHDALVEARTGITRRAEALVVADDLAGAMGWMVSPDYALDALVPCYRAMAAEASAAGANAIFHSDGDIRSLFAALARGGFDAVHAAGMRGPALSTYAHAATAVGLVTVGGLPASDLLVATSAIAEEAVQLAWETRLMIADDGGVAGPEELAALVTAMRRVERLAT